MCLWLAADPAGRIYLYRELYQTGRLVEDHAVDIIELSRRETIVATVCDHDAEGRATLERRGIETCPAFKSITTGIQAVQARLRQSLDGRPRLFVMRDCLVERDPKIVAAKKPCGVVEEFESYSWATPKEGRIITEKPIDADNHSLDALRYAVMVFQDVEDIQNQPLGGEVIIPCLLEARRFGRVSWE